MTRNLTEVLYSIVPEATFEIERLGVFSAETLQSAYLDATEMSRSAVAAAKPSAPEELLSELKDVLRTLLREYLVDDCFGQTLAHGRGGYSALDIASFASDVVPFAAAVGPERAAEWISDLASGKPIPYRLSAVLLGLNVDQPLELEDGIRFRNLPTSSDALENLPMSHSRSIPLSRVLGALMVEIDCEMGPGLCKPGESDLFPDQAWGDGATSEDPVAVLCTVLSLANNCYVAPILRWPDFSDEMWMLKLITGKMFSYSEENSMYLPVITMKLEHLDSVRRVLSNWAILSREGGGLDLAVDRWMRSKRQKSDVDKFIELRIALEALYLQDARGELGFRLANYGAWHLGANFAERKRYRAVLSQAYRKASEAVHRAEVADTEANRKLLSEAQDLCRMGILKRLDETEKPDWDEVILGGPDG